MLAEPHVLALKLCVPGRARRDDGGCGPGTGLPWLIRGALGSCWKWGRSRVSQRCPVRGAAATRRWKGRKGVVLPGACGPDPDPDPWAGRWVGRRPWFWPRSRRQ